MSEVTAFTCPVLRYLTRLPRNYSATASALFPLTRHNRPVVWRALVTCKAWNMVPTATPERQPCFSTCWPSSLDHKSALPCLDTAPYHTESQHAYLYRAHGRMDRCFLGRVVPEGQTGCSVGSLFGVAYDLHITDSSERFQGQDRRKRRKEGDKQPELVTRFALGITLTSTPELGRIGSWRTWMS